MKKAERTEKIIKLADEYARSGKCPDWQSVESKLCRDGLDEARDVLHDRYTRQSLDELCSIATSETEKNRREEFNRWVDEIVKRYSEIVREKFPYIELRVDPIRRANYRLEIINRNRYLLRLVRRFNSSQMEIEKSSHTHGEYYKPYSMYDIIAQDFKQLGDKEIEKIIFDQIEAAEKYARRNEDSSNN
jgi:hypothetical protein